MVKKNILNGIMMRKKYLAILMIFVCWASLCGFQKVEYGAVLNESGSVTEFISISYDSETLSKLGVTQEDFNTELENRIWNSTYGIKVFLENLFRNKVSELSQADQMTYLGNVSLTFNNSQGTTNQIVFAITYSTTSIWNYFCNSLDNIPTVTYSNSFLTYDVIRTSSIKFSQFNVMDQVVNTAELVYERLIALLTVDYGESVVNTLNEPDYFYSYVTSIGRIHSNATEPIISYNGYYYHVWQFDNLENNEIIIYTTHANKIVWYGIALVATAIFIGLIIFIDKRKKSKKEIEKQIS